MSRKLSTPTRSTRTARTTRLLALAAAVAACVVPSLSSAAPISVLFVGNSYTFGRTDPVLSYNAANVRDLTKPQGAAGSGAPFSDPTGTNSYAPGTPIPGSTTGAVYDSFSPHTPTNGWGGVAGIFKQMTVQAGLDYDVALSTRNAASLRGHLLNTANPTNWDLRGNIASQTWGKVVLQEQSDEPLTRQPGLNSNPEYFRFYADKIENFIHRGNAETIRDRDAFPGATAALRQAACVAAGIATGTCSNGRDLPANANASANTELYLYQTWARPDLINMPGTRAIDPVTGNASYSGALATSYFTTLEAMTAQLKTSYQAAFEQADNDGSPGFKAVAPVGEAFLRAVTSGVATRDMYGANALSDGLLDLWFNDGTHASKWGSYLSALTLFGTMTGIDPMTLGMNEIAARDLGISTADALILQRVASMQLRDSGLLPEPGTGALVAVAALAAVGVRRRVTARAAAERACA